MNFRKKDAPVDTAAKPPDEVPEEMAAQQAAETSKATTEPAAEEAATPESQPEKPAEDAENGETKALVEAVEKATAERDEYLALAQRVQADFDNYRRHNKNARAESFDEGARAFIKTVLPVLDNLDRALEVESADDKLAEGVRMVRRQLWDAMEKRGVSVIDRKGERFDPNLENAVMQGSAEEGDPGTVCAVLQTGYKMGDTVLRHAMVRVVADS